jgi:hypothetical protein
MKAYWHVILQANPLTFQDIQDMRSKTLDDVTEECGLAAKWKAEGEVWGEARSEERGIERGAIREKANAVITVLRTRFQSVPETVQKSIRSYSDLTALDSLLQAAVTCENVKDFRQNLVR